VILTRMMIMRNKEVRTVVRVLVVVVVVNVGDN
jgi:hypothetical protein